MDNEPGDADGDTQRVRILSTLESTRRPARGPMKIRGITKKKRSNWQAKALVGLMAVGVLSLLASFVMVLLNGHAPSARSDAADQAALPSHPSPAAKPATASRAHADNPLATLIAAPARTDANTATRPEQAAVIENVAIATPTMSKGTSSGQSTTGAPANMSADTKAAPAQSAAAKSPITTTAPAKAEPAKPAIVALAIPASPQAAATVQDASKQAGKPAPPTGKRTQAGGRNDEDVALLEAMFAHTRPRPADSAADEIKRRCSGLSAPDAATCRARVCVQSPTAAVCHQD